MSIIDFEQIKDAKDRIEDFVIKTPLIRSEYISQFCSGNVFLKLENLQHTNAFKIRGALNRMLQLNSQEREYGVITASSGNHAQGIALAAEHLKISAKIVVPTSISIAKLNKLKKYNVTIIQKGDFDTMEREARDLSAKEGLTYISPYNDVGIIAGQGTITLEIYEELPHLNYILAPVGGGGLISGIAVAAKSLVPEAKIIGTQTKGASTMYESWKAGKVMHIKEFQTVAEGLSGGLEDDALTLELIKKYVDEIVLVKEESVKKAISLLWQREGQIVEGAAATVVAHILEEKNKFANKDTVAVISGGNIDDYLFRKIVKKNIRKENLI